MIEPSRFECWKCQAQWVVCRTYDPVLALGQRFDSHFQRSFCCNPLGRGIYCTIPSLGWDLKQEVPCLCTHNTCKISSRSSKKSRPLWPVMMDDSVPTHERRKLIKTYKNVPPQKQIVVAKVCGETYSKKME